MFYRFVSSVCPLSFLSGLTDRFCHQGQQWCCRHQGNNKVEDPATPYTQLGCNLSVFPSPLEHLQKRRKISLTSHWLPVGLSCLQLFLRENFQKIPVRAVWYQARELKLKGGLAQWRVSICSEGFWCLRTPVWDVVWRLRLDASIPIHLSIWLNGSLSRLQTCFFFVFASFVAAHAVGSQKTTPAYGFVSVASLWPHKNKQTKRIQALLAFLKRRRDITKTNHNWRRQRVLLFPSLNTDQMTLCSTHILKSFEVFCCCSRKSAVGALHTKGTPSHTKGVTPLSQPLPSPFC